MYIYLAIFLSTNIGNFMEKATEYRIVFITIDKLEDAKTIAGTLVKEGLAACCNIIPNITSIYTWEGKVEEDGELLIIVKSSAERLEQLEKRVKEIHSYDVPEILSFALDESHAPYMKWMGECLK